MIRFLLALVFLHATMFGLASCTSSSNSDDSAAEDSGPIDDAELDDEGEGNTTADTGGEDDLGIDEGDDAPAEGEVAQNESATEDDLDAEFEDQETKESEDVASPAGEAPLADDLADQDLQESPVETPPPVVSEDTPAPIEEPIPVPTETVEKARVRDIRFVANSSGGTVVIDTSSPVTYQTRMNPATRQFVIEMADVELPAKLQRPMKGRGGRIGAINAYQGEGSNTARVVVQLSGNGGEPIVQQEGTSLVVIPPAAPVVADVPEVPRETVQDTPAPASQQALAARTLDEFLTGNQVFYGRPMSLQVKDADIRDVVNFLAEDSGANVVISDDVSGKISLKLRRIPWDQALVTIMRTKALGYVRQGNVLRISTLKALQEEAEAANRIIEAQKAIVPAVVQVLSVSYADLEDLSKNVTPFLSKDGRVVADKRTSTLILTDRGDVVERVRRLVKTLDIPPAQVSIESKIVEAAEEFNTFVGINWGFTGSKVNLSPSGGANKGPIDMTLGMQATSIDNASGSANPLSAALNIGVLDGLGSLTAALSLAERDSLAKVISSPRISAMNRERSTIRQEGENVTIVSSRSETTGTIARSEKRTPFSLELNVTPQITSDGGVIMDLDVRREFLGPLVDTETGARPVNRRFAKTRVLVRNGQTAVIGGIYTSDELESSNGVPGLKNIPVLGWLFKSKSFLRTKNELLIFLTPRIIAQDVGTSMAAAGSDENAEDAVE